MSWTLWVYYRDRAGPGDEPGEKVLERLLKKRAEGHGMQLSNRLHDIDVGYKSEVAAKRAGQMLLRFKAKLAAVGIKINKVEVTED